MAKPNKPVRISKEVKDTLKAIKQEKDLKSIDAVLKRLLKNNRGII
jgi:predicted CopG family antitoxin